MSEMSQPTTPLSRAAGHDDAAAVVVAHVADRAARHQAVRRVPARRRVPRSTPGEPAERDVRRAGTQLDDVLSQRRIDRSVPRAAPAARSRACRFAGRDTIRPAHRVLPAARAHSSGRPAEAYEPSRPSVISRCSRSTAAIGRMLFHQSWRGKMQTSPSVGRAHDRASARRSAACALASRSSPVPCP